MPNKPHKLYMPKLLATLLEVFLLFNLSACRKVEKIPAFNIPLVDLLANTENAQQNIPNDPFSPLTHLKRDFRPYYVSSYNNNSYGEKKIWLPPRLIIEPGETLQPLPVDVLLRVEVQTYPKIDCNATDLRTKAPAEKYLAPMSREELASYGKPVLTKEIWIVPSVTGPNKEIFDLDFGPLWLGNALRLAGKDKRVFFYPSQNCEADYEYNSDDLPTDMFTFAPSLSTLRNGSGSVDIMSISALRPYTAKVVEVCPNLSITATGKTTETTNKIIPSYSNSKTDYIVTVRAQCASGEKVVTTDKAWHEREPQRTYYDDL